MIYYPFTRSFSSLEMRARLRKAFDFLNTTDFSSKADGTYPIDGDEIYVMVQSFHVCDPIDAEFETHRNHIDIQYVLQGCLNLKIAKREILTSVSPYDEHKDVIFYSRTSNACNLILYPGQAAVLFPEDAHRMVCFPVDGQEAFIRKCTVKVRT